MLVLSIVFSVIILCSATGVYIYISKTFIEPLQQIYKLLETLNKSEFTYLRPLTLKYAHDYFKKIFYGLTESVKIVHRLEMKRNQSEKNLRYNEIKYREIADFLPQSIFETDENCIITYVNKTWLGTFGYSKQEVKEGINLKNIFNCDDFNFILNDDRIYEQECNAVRKDGKTISAFIYMSQIIKDNRKHGIRGLIINDTERKRQIEELEKAKAKAEQSDKLKSAFLANMSHEIRTPMNAIIGFSNLLYEKQLTDDLRKEYLNYVKSSGEHLLKLIDDIIDIAKIEAGELKINKIKVNLNFVLHELHSWFENIRINTGKDFSLNVNIENENQDFIVITDPLRLKQVLTNLIGNAVKFTNNGFVEFGYTVYGDIIQFHVKDTGIGIPEHLHNAIFDRFHQVDYIKFNGTGLGLTITKNIINILGGRIWLHSEIYKGSTFYFTIPYEPVKTTIEAPEIIAEIQNKVILSGKKILIAEDNDSNFDLLERLLAHTGLKIFRAKNGKEAIRLGLKSVDIILMDMQLPIIDGYTATQQIKRLRPEVPIIAQTAYVYEQDRLNCLEAGCDAYLSKPINKEQLLSAISRNLSEKNKIYMMD